MERSPNEKDVQDQTQAPIQIGAQLGNDMNRTGKAAAGVRMQAARRRCARKRSEGDMSDYFAGSDWSQTYAKEALPVLVSLAESHRATTYTELAKILLG